MFDGFNKGYKDGGGTKRGVHEQNREVVEERYGVEKEDARGEKEEGSGATNNTARTFIER